jgi:hypothetical protein
MRFGRCRAEVEPVKNRENREAVEQEGSAMVVAIFVLVLLSGMGLALLLTADADVKMNQAGHRATRAFFYAEAGLEDARTLLAANNLASASPDSLDDELVAAAGSNASMNFNVNQLKPTYSGTNVTGFTGYGDDAPIRGTTSFSGGWYAAFLTNDPIDVQGGSFLDDTNDRVMITAIGAGSDHSVEVVQAVVEKLSLPALPATITVLGPSPTEFQGGSSGAKEYVGDDCVGAAGYTGVSGYSVPVVGTVGPGSEAVVGSDVETKGGTYDTDGYNGDDVVDDLTSTTDPIWTQTIDPLWRDCAYLQILANTVRNAADYICTTSSPCSHWATSTITTVTYVEGDLDLGSNDGKGILWVTGQLHVRGNSSWEGPIYVVGEGDFLRDGGGNGETIGGILLANISGPDGIYGNTDDCTGPGPDPGMSPVSFLTDGGGNHETIYCSDAINQALNGLPLHVVEFRQR